MATIKSYTDLSQSKTLSKILPLESADFGWNVFIDDSVRCLPIDDWDLSKNGEGSAEFIPCWSNTALLKYLSEIKPQVYTPVLFPSEGKWILQFAEYGHGSVCVVFCDNPVDACVAMIEKLHKQKLL